MLEPFSLPFVQRGLIEVLILAVPAGLLGTWIVLRGLAFFSHAVGTAAFPGLVLADGIGFAAPLGAIGAALAFAACVWLLGRGRSGRDAAVALSLVAALAAGVILASDVFESGPGVESLLFGSLLLVDGGDLAFAAAAALAAAAASAALGPRWLAEGFDPGGPRPAGGRARALDAALIALVALAIVAALVVVGALLAAALFVVPAATARLLTERLLPWQALSVVLVAAEGTAGLWLSVQLDAPPGATIATLSGIVFAVVAAARAAARRRPAALGLAAVAVPLLLAGCGGDADRDERLDVVATTTPVGDLAREVGGEDIDLHVLLRPGADPHGYEPRPRDVLAAADAEVALASGAGLDGWVDEVLADAGSDARAIELADVAAGGEGDPHWWQDPRGAIPVVRAIERALTAARPAAAGAFARRADRYVARLAGLDAAIAACIDSVPAADRRIVTDHDAFGAFAERYGIEIVGVVIPAQTTEAQPSARDLSELVDAVESEGVGAVLTERSLSPAAARAVARQTGAEDDLSLYGDSLGPPGSEGDTYIGMLAANADAVTRALTEGRRGCDPSR